MTKGQEEGGKDEFLRFSFASAHRWIFHCPSGGFSIASAVSPPDGKTVNLTPVQCKNSQKSNAE